MKRLQTIFDQAVQRVLTKGQERHGFGGEVNFNDQPIFQIPSQLRADNSPLLFQAVKKIYESHRGNKIFQRNELLDAIIYLACAIIYMEEQDVNSY